MKWCSKSLSAKISLKLRKKPDLIVSVAYLQPTYAKLLIDQTLAANFNWFKRQSRYAAAVFVGLVETISYCSLHVMFSLATFPLTMGYVDSFPRKASYYGARACGGVTATTVAAGAIFGLCNPQITEDGSIAEAIQLRDAMLGRFKNGWDLEARNILEYKLTSRKMKISCIEIFNQKADKYKTIRSDYCTSTVKITPHTPNEWFDMLQETSYQIYVQSFLQRQKLWKTSIDPYYLACKKAEKCKNRILKSAREMGGYQEDSSKICLDAVRSVKSRIAQALEEVQYCPESAKTFCEYLKDYEQTFLATLRSAIEKNIPCPKFASLKNPWVQ